MFDGGFYMLTPPDRHRHFSAVILQIFCKIPGIFYLITTIPLPGCIIPQNLGGVFGQKLNQRIHIDPDLMIAFSLGFVKNELQSQMKVTDVDIVDIFLGAVSRPPHITDDVSGLDQIS